MKDFVSPGEQQETATKQVSSEAGRFRLFGLVLASILVALIAIANTI